MSFSNFKVFSAFVSFLESFFVICFSFWCLHRAQHRYCATVSAPCCQVTSDFTDPLEQKLVTWSRALSKPNARRAPARAIRENRENGKTMSNFNRYFNIFQLFIQQWAICLLESSGILRDLSGHRGHWLLKSVTQPIAMIEASASYEI